MTISSGLKTTNLLLLSNRRRQNFDGDNNIFCCSKSIYFPPISRSARVKAKSFLNSNSNSISISTNEKDASIAPHIEESQSSSKDGNSALNAALNILKWLRIPAVVGTLSLLLTMIMFGHDQSAALASSVGAMGGRSIQPLSWQLYKRNTLNFFALIGVIRFSCAHPNQFESLSYFFGMTALHIAGYITDLRMRVKLVKLQVALYVDRQDLQKDLNYTAQNIDGSDPGYWSCVLNDTAESLLRHEKHWISGYLLSDLKEKREDAEEFFKKHSMKEWRKSGVKTLVNLDDMENIIIVNTQEANQFKNTTTTTYMVVTIVVAATGMLQIPTMPEITNPGTLNKALKVLKLISESSRLLGVNVFWTPQKENDIMSSEEFQSNYLLLKPFNASS